jgi:hypothetical protein
VLALNGALVLEPRRRFAIIPPLGSVKQVKRIQRETCDTHGADRRAYHLDHLVASVGKTLRKTLMRRSYNRFIRKLNIGDSPFTCTKEAEPDLFQDYVAQCPIWFQSALESGMPEKSRWARNMMSQRRLFQWACNAQ